MFSHYYILFFFDQGLIVMICFFSFLFFAILTEKGQYVSLAAQSGSEARSKLERHLATRAGAILELAAHAGTSATRMRNIASSYSTTSRDVVLRSGYVVKRSLTTYLVLKTQYYSDSIVTRIQYLTSEIRSYFARCTLAGGATKSQSRLFIISE